MTEPTVINPQSDAWRPSLRSAKAFFSSLEQSALFVMVMKKKIAAWILEELNTANRNSGPEKECPVLGG